VLPVIQLTINNTFNSSIRESPFYSLFGYDSATVTLTPPKTQYSEDELHQHMKRIQEIRSHCREKLLESQAAYTTYTNSGRKEKSISIGDRVYAKINVSQLRKLDLPISGPFLVIGSKGKAWELQDMITQKTSIVHPDYIINRKTPVTSDRLLSDSNSDPPTRLPAAAPRVTKPVLQPSRQQPARACKR
jgi:hypothetical protein